MSRVKELFAMFDFYPWGTNVLLQAILSDESDPSWQRGDRVREPRDQRSIFGILSAWMAKARGMLHRPVNPSQAPALLDQPTWAARAARPVCEKEKLAA